MTTTRLEAYSDAVIAIVITIMVLELRPPEGGGFAALRSLLPTFLAYLLSFIYLSIYWNNHHHMLHVTERVTGGIMWANIHLLFWLSLVPFTTAWLSEHPSQTAPAVLYGLDLLMAAVAYYILQSAIIVHQGQGSTLARALGADIKGKVSPLLYILAIAAAYYLPWLSYSMYVFVALMWLVPDRRIEGNLVEGGEE